MGNIKVDPFRWESVTCFPKPTRINQHFQNREPSEIGPDGDHARTEIDPFRIIILGTRLQLGLDQQGQNAFKFSSFAIQLTSSKRLCGSRRERGASGRERERDEGERGEPC